MWNFIAHYGFVVASVLTLIAAGFGERYWSRGQRRRSLNKVLGPEAQLYCEKQAKTR